MIQRDPGTHGPDNPDPGGSHQNPGEKAKSGLSHLLGQNPLPQQGSAGTQSGAAAAAPAQKSFQPPQGATEPVIQKPTTPLPSFQPPAGTLPKVGADDKPQPTNRGTRTGNNPQNDAESIKRDKKPTDPDTGEAYPKTNRGQRTGNNPENDPNSLHRDKGKVPGGPGHPNPGEAAKSSLARLFGLDKPLPQKGKAGTQSGSAPEKKGGSGSAQAAPAPTGDEYREPAGAPPKAGQLKVPHVATDDDKPQPTNRGTRTGNNPQDDPESLHRDKGTHGPDNPDPGGSHKNPGEKAKGGMAKKDAPLNKDNPSAAGVAPATSSSREPGKPATKPAIDPDTGEEYPMTNRGRRTGSNLEKDPNYLHRDRKSGHGPNNPDPGGSHTNPGEGEKGAWKNFPASSIVGPEAVALARKYGTAAGIMAALFGANWLGDKLGGGGGGGHGGGHKGPEKSGYAYPHVHGHDEGWAIPTSPTMRARRKMMYAPQQQNEETSENTKERRKVGFIERAHKHGDASKERRKVAYLERKPDKHNLRHRFSSKTLQGRETLAGMDEERFTSIMREAIDDAKAKKKKRTEGGFSKTPVDTNPHLKTPDPNDVRS